MTTRFCAEGILRLWMISSVIWVKSDFVAAWTVDTKFPSPVLRLHRVGSRFQPRTVVKQTSTVSGVSPLRSSYNDDCGGKEKQEYRSIADVVGGLHGGKYQFDGVGAGGAVMPGDAFSGQGSPYGTEEASEQIEDEELPNWAQKMGPNKNNGNNPALSVPSNSDPMDGMVYSASIEVRNQERTWEKFYAKVMVRRSAGVPSGVGDGEFSEVRPSDLGLSVAPLSGFLAPRGGASNACDASQPYSDAATLRVTQAPDTGTNRNGVSDGEDLWLVVGTEEEQWTYQLDLLRE